MNELVRAKIEKNIRSSGYHLYGVLPVPMPRFFYSVGLLDKVGLEVAFCGGAQFYLDDVQLIIRRIADALARGASESSVFDVGELGAFSLGEVTQEWCDALLLGAVDYYRARAPVRALQILPEQRFWTIDIPCLNEPLTTAANGPWRWNHEPWPYPAPANSIAMTNLRALRGERVTEAARWEPEDFELFAGPGPAVSEADARAVPLGTLIGHDTSIAPVAHLEVGAALRRDAGVGDWVAWQAQT